MSDYFYKGFQVLYKITFKPTLDRYEARGRIDLLDDKSPFSQEFSTQGHSSQEAEQQIKKLIEHYIDFEWQQYILH